MIFIVFLIGITSSYAQVNRSTQTETKSEQQLSITDSLLVNGFVESFELFASKMENNYDNYFFTTEEVDRFTTHLMSEKYPDVSGELSSDILERSEIVKLRVNIIAFTCNQAKIVYMEKKIGLTDALDGILVEFSFGKDNEWKESLSVLFTVFEKSLKVLSFKDEK